MTTKSNVPAGNFCPLVILPGLLCDSRMFTLQINEFDAIVIDGFYGGSSSIETMASYALGLMPDRCALLGHSMGARVALEIWQRDPERISRLALADAGTHGPSPEEARKRFDLRDVGRAKGAKAMVDQWLPPMIGELHRDDADLVAMLRAMAIDAGVDTYETQITALLDRPDAAAVLPTVTCPVYVIVGRDDTWSPVAQHEAIVALLPSARLRVVENAGHMAPAEEPTRFNGAVKEWLSWVPGGKTSLLR